MKAKEKLFLELTERFRAASDPERVKKLGHELGGLCSVSNASNHR